MKYLLDTDTVSLALRGTPAVCRNLLETQPEDVAISAITEFELWYGLEKKGSKKLFTQVSAFLAPLRVLPVDSAVARKTGELLAVLERKGRPIGLNDTMIGATALIHGLILVSGNEKHFERLEKLQIQNWNI